MPGTPSPSGLPSGNLPDVRLRKMVVDALADRVIRDATGMNEKPFVRYTGPAPKSRFWLGMLLPEESVVLPGTGTGRGRGSSDRIIPASEGFSFRVASLPLEIEITLSFALWINLHPTLDEQRARVGQGPGEDESEDELPPNSGAPGKSEPALKEARPRMKIPVSDIRIPVTLASDGARSTGGAEIRDAINRALAPYLAVAYRPRHRQGRLPRAADIENATTWANWVSNNLGDPVVPEWYAEVDIETGAIFGGGYEILVTVVNRTPEDQFVDRDRSRKFPSGTCDLMLYEVELACTPSQTVLPYQLEQIPNSYRYDRAIPALGANAAVDVVAGRTLTTVFAARAETNRIYPRTEDAQGMPLDMTFATLKTDPLPALTRLVREGQQWTTTNWGQNALDAMARRDGWTSDSRKQADEDAQEAQEEIDWVNAGLGLLSADATLLEAFKAMNEAMEAVANARYTSWRPFQIAFILGCLKGVVDPATTSTVDILWFSTGGGKTEAYLGLNLVHLFYARLNGRTSGSQTWARFPLRLLSLQQTQRFANSIIQAELVRRHHPRMRGAPFSIGYYVGSGNTKNKIELPSSRFYDGWDPFDPKNAETCRVLELCPACRGPEKPVVYFDGATHSMVHECRNPGCPLAGERLPVYVIDDDIYRFAPTVLVGTVDKLAQLGQQASFRVLLGRALGKCPKHGYSPKADECAIFGCKEAMGPVPAGFKGIAFEIQDELHLLNESLGALDGNYETLFQAVATEPAIQIIGATATIEGFRDQVDHLYRRTPRRFPIPGPRKEASFWAHEIPDEPLRLYVAMLPRGTTMLNAAYFITGSHLRFIEEGLGDSTTFCTDVLGVSDTLAPRVATMLRDDYEVMTTYALRKPELERYAADVTGDSALRLTANNLDRITGDTEFFDVRNALDRLEKPPSDPALRIRVLAATSAISHGVDINRLNVMTMMGMPKQTAEFIQATARVGRAYPGIVFALINPARERDVSHFRYFRKYAEYLDRLVEPVPVNRESLPVLRRALPGGLMAFFLQVYEPDWLFPGGRPAAAKPRRNRLWHVSGVAQAIDEGFLTETDVSERLRAAFAIDAQNPRFADHCRAIEDFVTDQFTRFLAVRSSGNPTKDEMDPPPPRSLRDVEAQIEVRGER
jgi:hypothetical protein